jgi:hypothetical protein
MAAANPQADNSDNHKLQPLPIKQLRSLSTRIWWHPDRCPDVVALSRL